MDIIQSNVANKHVPMDGDAFKVDTDESQTLLSIADYYRNIEGHETMVRPWIDGDYAAKPSLALITQFALYKCMHTNCIFSTDDDDHWAAHMVDHIKFMDVLDANGWLTNSVRSDQIKFRECPYCPAEFGSNCEISDHIEDQHRRSIFQCAYCYYRTIEMDCIVMHYNQFHTDEHPEILMTGDSREFGQKEQEVLGEGEQYVDLFECRK